MARKELQDRQFTLYLPSRSDLLRWKKLSKPLTLNRWIYEAVESFLEGRPSGLKDTSELNVVRTENADLKEQLKNLTEKIYYFELREERRSKEPSPFAKEIIGVLQAEDKYWDFNQIVNYIIENDILKDDVYEYTREDITRNVRKAIDGYEKLGFISIKGQGCKWIG